MGVLVTIQDIRGAHLCSAGAREWFTQHGLDWDDFVKNGMDSDRGKDIDDVMMQQVIRNAEKRHGR